MPPVARGFHERVAKLLSAVWGRGFFAHSARKLRRVAVHAGVSIASGHYLRAVVLQELGDHELARQSLQRAVYLSPDMVLAHFALGNLARAGSKNTEAIKHFNNALHFLKNLRPDDVLPESDGMTAGRLIEIISSITSLETTPGKGE